jgi:hypothetical protein
MAKQQKAARDKQINSAMKKAATISDVIRNFVLSDDESMLNQFISIGTEMGLLPESLERYASSVNVYMFNTERLRQVLYSTTGSTEIGPDIDINDSWSGMFVSRFNNFGAANSPAIFIKTDAESTLEYIKTLAQNLKLRSGQFTEETVRHELAHAARHLGLGHITGRDSMNKDRAAQYISKPEEIAARVFGDVPYMRELFTQKLEEMSDQPLVERAVSNQFVHEVENNKWLGAVLGLVNPQQLQDEAANNQKRFHGMEKPLDEVDKIREQQRETIKSAFRFIISKARQREKSEIVAKLQKEQQSLQVLQSNLDITPEQKQQQMEYHDQEISKLNNEIARLDSGGIPRSYLAPIGDSIAGGYYEDYLYRLLEAIGTEKIKVPGMNRLPEESPEMEKLIEQQTRKLESQDIKDLADFMVSNSPGGTQGYGAIMLPGVMMPPNRNIGGPKQ